MKMMRCRPPLLLTVSIVVSCVYVWLRATPWWRERGYGAEQLASLELQSLLNDMRHGHGPNVAGKDTESYVISFDSFYDYVRKVRPDVVAERNARNPFPGLLPGKSYGRRSV